MGNECGGSQVSKLVGVRVVDFTETKKTNGVRKYAVQKLFTHSQYLDVLNTQTENNGVPLLGIVNGVKVTQGEKQGELTKVNISPIASKLHTRCVGV